jgi:hypothetical protein
VSRHILVSFREYRRVYTVSIVSGPFAHRTHTCGALTAADAGTRVVLAGWLLPER